MSVSNSRLVPARGCLRYLERDKLIVLAVVLAVIALGPSTYSGARAHSKDRSSQDGSKTHSLRAYTVSSSEDFQASLIDANPGDVITLQAGAVLRGNFFLPEKSPNSESEWIVIRSSAADMLPQEGVRVTPAHAAMMPKLESPNSEPALATRSGANHYRFEGIEFTIGSDVRLNQGIVRLGDGNETDVASLPHDLIIDPCYVHGNALADVSRGIALNSARSDIVNSYVSDCHGLGFDTQAIAGWNGPGPYRIVNNYLEASGENVMFGGADPKISGLVPSDIEFRQNHCTKPLSWMEGILAKPTGVIAQGYSTPGNLAAGATYYYRISGRGRAGYSSVVHSAASDEVALTLAVDQTSAAISWSPGDYISEARIYRTGDPPGAPVRQWVFYTAAPSSFIDVGEIATAQFGQTPPESGNRWSVKNLFELKNARRVVIDGNVFENNWVDAQSGFCILLTVRNQDGTADWSVVEDVSLTNNLVRHSAGGVNLLGRDNLQTSDQAKRIEINSNIFDDIGGSHWGGNGRFLQIAEAVDVKIDHNTVVQTGNIITAYGVPNRGFIFTNNIALHNDYGIIGDGSSPGVLTLEKYFPEALLKRNVIVGGPKSRYPKKNYYPPTLADVGFVDTNGNYKLSATSIYKNAGTQNRDVGADIEAVDRAASRALQGLP